ncbi:MULTISPECIES: multi-tm2 domain protein [Saccharibacillus]|uniref:multi-tm2 domain protein n=1 Tax=Saccharibacillus TaxID=456492 RepID=UPI00123BCF10|nr:multi-tm2 domain protein [Saccharibacillus sp. WB 17]MWJ33355.1 multi-tm2 domain protein [Saccharibacillus sp. WB 17]
MNRLRSKLAALLLNLVPGLGHVYWGNRSRGFIYFLLPLFMLIGGGLLAAITESDAPMALGIAGTCLVWFISMFDMLVAVLSRPLGPDAPPGYYAHASSAPRHPGYADDPYGAYRSGEPGAPRTADREEEPRAGFGPGEDAGYPTYPPYPPIGDGRMLREPNYFSDVQRFCTVILSFVPGLGHLYMGLVQRGVSFLAAFFGLTTALVFLSIFTGEETFLMFLGVLPIIWIYGMFDAVQLAGRKSRGEQLRDFSLIERWDMGRDGSGKSRTMGLLLAIVPGAAHMYLGLMKRGAQLMILFFGSIYILDVLGLSIFLFLVPLIWFYAFFDALQQVGRYGREPLVDKPLLDNFEANRGWLGVLLVALGLYYVLKTLVMPFIDLYLPTLGFLHQLEPYIRNAVVALLLIGGGFKLMKTGRRARA